MAVLVIGGVGELGWEVVKAARRSPAFEKCVATFNRTTPSNAERKATPDVEWVHLDCSDHAAARRVLDESSASAVVYCAVPTHGGANGKGGAAVNSGIVDDVLNVASAKSSQVRFVVLSTDLVYDGRIPVDARYNEQDAPTPTNFYARAKVDMETNLASIANVCVARTSLILTLADEPGESAVRTWPGKGVRFVLNALEGKLSHEPFQMFTDEKRNMSFSDDLAAALMQLASPSCKYEGIVHLVADEVATRYELACLLAKQFLTEDCIGKTVCDGLSSESGMNRPLNCALDTSLLHSLLADTNVRIRGLSERF